MKRYILLVLTGFMLFTLAACSDDDDLKSSIFDTSERDRTEVDLWLLENFIDPYNIDVVYKWQDSQTGLGYNLTPPEEGKAWELAKALKTMWIEPYVEEGGVAFFNKLSPKQVVFIGSARFNSDGSYTQGAGDSEHQIVLYAVNDFSTSDSARLKKYMGAIHGSFALVALLTQEFPKEYESISGGYVEQWKNIKDQEAFNAGFISPYAMSEPNIDVSEMVSEMLTRSREDWELMLQMPETDEAKKMLEDKFDMILTYYREVWNVDLYALQEKAENAINKILKGTNE